MKITIIIAPYVTVNYRVNSAEYIDNITTSTRIDF